jgi:restriction endonuclease S subunit
MYVSFVPDPEMIDASWLSQAINSAPFRSQLQKFVKGTTRERISRRNLEGLRLRVPPLPEQRRIAAILDKVDALRSLRIRALATVDSVAESLFAQVLRSNPKTVARLSIDEVVETIIDYRGRSPQKVSDGVPLITARVVKHRELMPTTEFIAETDYDSWMRRGLPRRGDVIFTTEAPLGEVAQVEDPRVALAQRLLVLRGKSDVVDNTFLMFALTAPEVRRQIESRSTGSTVRGIRQSELRQVLLPVPPLNEQQLFADKLSASCKLKRRLRESLARLDALFASTEHRAFAENSEA